MYDLCAHRFLWETMADKSESGLIHKVRRDKGREREREGVGGGGKSEEMGRKEGEREGQMKRGGNEVMSEKKRRRRGGGKVTYGR